MLNILKTRSIVSKNVDTQSKIKINLQLPEKDMIIKEKTVNTEQLR